MATNPAYHSKTKHIDVISLCETCNRWRQSSSQEGPHTGKSCRYIHEASFSIEAEMVSRFSRLAEKMMNGHGQGIRKIVVKVEFVKNVTTKNVNYLLTINWLSNEIKLE